MVKDLLRLLRKWFSWLPFVRPDWTEEPKDHRASFLFDNATTRCMNILSAGVSEQHFRNVVARCRGNGDTLMYVFLANYGDGPGVTDFYAGAFGGEIDKHEVKAIRKRMQYILDEGLRIVGVMTADDSRPIKQASFPARLRHVQHCIKQFGDLCCAWWIGLELDEYTAQHEVRALVFEAKSRTKRSVGVHWSPRKTDPCGADTLYYQHGFGLSPARVESETRGVVERLPGTRVIAAEYHKSSDTQDAKALGQAAMRGGAKGTGNGR